MELEQDLAARQQARELVRRAERAQQRLQTFSQQQLDAICAGISRRFAAAARELGQQAAHETGFGNPRDKEQKNLFAARQVWQAIEPMKTVGLLREDPQRKLWEIGVSVGLIAAIVPGTNPTSTVCYKALIALKSGNCIIFSPHPRAVQCTCAAARLVEEAAREAGAPEGCVGCLSIASMAGCQELMAAPQVRLILATGGPGMVRAAYSSGKPAIGVGAGNGPAYLHHSADVRQAMQCILRSKTFDNGTVCASEQSIIIERSMEQAVRREGQALGFYFLDTAQAALLAKLLFRPDGTVNPQIVGRRAVELAEKAGFSVPPDTAVLVAREQEAGPTRPYSMEKLCPVLAFFVMENENAVLEKAVEVLSHEGAGHTFAMHATDRAAVERFALRIPVSRFLVNTPAALGGIGQTTALFPALTLGCGAAGGSSSSNNISPMDLINIRRVAWDTQQSCRKKEPEPELVERLTAKILERLNLPGGGSAQL